MKKTALGFVLSILAVNAGFGAACDSACSFLPAITTFGTFSTSIAFNATQTGSTADAPTFLTPDATRLKGITATANMPMIHLDVEDPIATGVGRAGTRIAYTVHVSSTFLVSPTFTGQHLFILPATSAGLPTFVTSWSMNADGTVLDIKLDKPGEVDLVFGQFPSTTPAGQASAVTPAVFDFATPPSQIALALTGTNFRTANPLILATPILAGSSTNLPVISGSYPTAAAPLKSAMATFGIRTLGDSLKKDRFLSYYQRAFSADSVPIAAVTEKKPFSLNSVTDTAVLKAATSADSDVTVDAATGNLSATVPLNLTVAGWVALSGSIPQVTRGVEVVLTVFDGGTITHGKAFVRSKFGAADLKSGDRTVQFDHGCWNLYSYPWDEDSGSAKVRLVGGSAQESNYRLLRYNGSSYVNLSQNDFSSYDDMGKAFWSGNSEGLYKPGTAGGKSLDYQTFSLQLTGGQWTDFGTPFNFPVRLKDVAAFDSLGTGHAIWHFDSASFNKPGKWVRLPADSSSLLLPWAGYTVKPASTITLKIPVRDTSRSLIRSSVISAKAAANAPIWLASFWVRDQTAISDLQLSKGGSAYTVEEAPSVPGQDFRAVFRAGDARWSVIQDDAAQGMQGHWALDVTPQRGFSSVQLGVGARKGESVPLYLVETLRGTSVPLGDSAVSLSAADLAHGDYHVVAGNATYVQSFLKSVGANQLNLVNFPNPFTEAGTSIRFSLPNTFSEVSYQVKIFDFQGRTVWEKSWKGGPLLNTYWDGKDLAGQRSPTGQYHLRVTAQVPGKSPFHAERNLIKLK